MRQPIPAGRSEAKKGAKRGEGFETGKLSPTAVYLRVSTIDQNPRSQEREVLEYCRRRGWATPRIFRDKASGGKASRPGLEEMMTAVRAGEIRTICCWKLDRLGRSLSHLALLLDELQRASVAVVFTSQGIDTTDGSAAGRLQLAVLGAVAEFERELIRERTLAGLAAARERGAKLGRPQKHDLAAIRRAAAKHGGSVRATARALNIHPSVVARALRDAP